MCANDYLVRFPAKAQNIDATNNNSLLVEQLTINNNNFVFQPADKIRLNYYENNLLLYYTVIDYETNDYRFFYRINAAGNWIATGREHSINLTNLQPGEYRIQLKALGKTGDEKLNELSIIIDPPFWKTTWFLLALALCMLTALYFLYRQRIKKIQQRANIDKLLAQTEMKALHAQMNPHFIFNSLNSIREMILINDNRNASHFLSKFAQLIRITLDQSGRHFISLRNTIDYLQRYVDMEQIRNNHFTCSIVVQDELDPDEILLPPMLIQPFIENAIWHGSADADKMINIQVLFKKLGQQLVCIVEDDGIGIEKSLSNKGSDPSHNPVGIGNIKNRIALLNEKYNLQSSLAITDKSLEGTGSTGTSVTLSLPLEISGYE
jgi:two-component sensor histidine kinase